MKHSAIASAILALGFGVTASAEAEPLPTAVAEAEPPSTAVHFDLKMESHSTVMTAPIAGPFVGISHGVGRQQAFHPRVWAGLGAMLGAETQGLAGELGASMTYYGSSRHDGIGVMLGGGLSVLGLDQQHDQESLLAGALVVEPSVVFTRGRFSALLGLRGKNVVYERLSSESMDESETELMLWKPEGGVKAGVSLAF